MHAKSAFRLIFGFFGHFLNMLAPREKLPALSSLRHTNLTRRIDPRHPGTSEILHLQKNMNSEFQISTHGKLASFSQNSQK